MSGFVYISQPVIATRQIMSCLVDNCSRTNKVMLGTTNVFIFPILYFTFTLYSIQFSKHQISNSEQTQVSLVMLDQSIFFNSRNFLFWQSHNLVSQNFLKRGHEVMRTVLPTMKQLSLVVKSFTSPAPVPLSAVSEILCQLINCCQRHCLNH